MEPRSAALGQRLMANDPFCAGKARPRLARLLWLLWKDWIPFKLSGRRGASSLAQSNLSSDSATPTLPSARLSTSAASSRSSSTLMDGVRSAPSSPVSFEPQIVLADSQLLRSGSSPPPFLSVSVLPRAWELRSPSLPSFEFACPSRGVSREEEYGDGARLGGRNDCSSPPCSGEGPWRWPGIKMKQFRMFLLCACTIGCKSLFTLQQLFVQIAILIDLLWWIT